MFYRNITKNCVSKNLFCELTDGRFATPPEELSWEEGGGGRVNALGSSTNPDLDSELSAEYEIFERNIQIQICITYK
jgi:hypothetical protein